MNNVVTNAPISAHFFFICPRVARLNVGSGVKHSRLGENVFGAWAFIPSAPAWGAPYSLRDCSVRERGGARPLVGLQVQTVITGRGAADWLRGAGRCGAVRCGAVPCGARCGAVPCRAVPPRGTQPNNRACILLHICAKPLAQSPILCYT